MSLRSEFTFLKSLPRWQRARFVLYALLIGGSAAWFLAQWEHHDAMGRELAKATAQAIRAAEAHRDRTTYIIHRPKAGCPAGWQLKVDFFRETDPNRREDACLGGRDDDQEVGIDYLRPGESAGVLQITR